MSILLSTSKNDTVRQHPHPNEKTHMNTNMEQRWEAGVIERIAKYPVH